MMLYLSLLPNAIPIDIPSHNYTCHTEKKVLLFDIDQTLYADTPEMKKHFMKDLSQRFEELGIKGDAPLICKEYIKKYGSVTKGILVNYPSIDTDLFQKVLNRKVNMLDFIEKDKKLIEMLESMKGYDMYCFTNAPKSHALNVLEQLEITRFFTGIYYPDYTSAESANCKPEIAAFTNVSKSLGDKTIHFFDDIEANVNSGREIGWICHRITNDYDIKSALQTIVSAELAITNNCTSHIEEENNVENDQEDVSGVI